MNSMSEFDNKKTSKALFKNTGIIALGQISTKFINFFLMPLYTAILSTEEYGLADVLGTYVNLITVCIGLQIPSAIFRFVVTVRDNKIETQKIVTSAFAIISAMLSLYLVLFLCVVQLINVEFKWYLIAAVIINIVFSSCTNISRGLGNNSAYAISSFLSAAITVILNVIGIAWLHMGVLSLLLSSIFGPLIGILYLVINQKLFTFIDVRFISIKEIKRILKYSIPLVPNELSWSIIHASDRLVVTNMLSLTANGLIAVASKFSSIYTTAFSFFNSSWTEQVVLHFDERGGPEYVSHMFEKMVTFFASIAIGIMVCMPFVFNVMIDSSYADAYGLIPIYLIAVFFNAVIGMISAIYLIHNETVKVALSTGIAAIINLTADILMINWIGVYAAPVSSVFGYLTISIWRVIDVNKRYCKIKIPRVKFLTLIFMLTVTLLTYYTDFRKLQFLALIIVAISAVIINRSLIMEMWSLINKNVRDR